MDYSNTVTQQSLGENEYRVHGKSGHLSFVTSLKHVIMLLKCNFFQGFILTPYQRTSSIHVWHCKAVRFFKSGNIVKYLNAFKDESYTSNFFDEME